MCYIFVIYLHTFTSPKYPRTLSDHYFSFFSGVGSRKADPGGSLGFDNVLGGNLKTRHCDFMDSLWNILCECESLNDLKSGLQKVFHAVATNQIRPQIHVLNNSQVGVTCLGLMRGQLAEPELSGIEPLLMLVQLGICKLKGQLATTLQACELASAEQLSPLLSKCGVGDNYDHGESVEQLHRLHLVIHIISCLRKYLKLSPNTLADHTAKLLEEISTEEGKVTSKPHSFSWTLSASCVKELLVTISPICWRLTLTCGTDCTKPEGRPKTLGNVSNNRETGNAGRRIGASHIRSVVEDEYLECSHERSLQVSFSSVPVVKIVSVHEDFGDLIEDRAEDHTRNIYYSTSVCSVRDGVIF